MAINRKPFSAFELTYFKAFDRWALKGATPNIFMDCTSPEELRRKAAKYPDVLRAALELAEKPIDDAKGWDFNAFKVIEKMERATLVYLFTGDKRAVTLAVEALSALEACKRPYWCFSSCIGVLDMDLRTATAVYVMSMMKCCMGDALDAGVKKRLRRQVVDRILRPALEAERNKTYPWMHSSANWRIILCGCFAVGAMAFAEDCPDYRELIEYGLEGVLVSLGTGDSAGGWNEGPGYWDYGLSFAVWFAQRLKAFTGGDVDLFRHPFLRKTGDFRLFMQTREDEIWNWSDAGKKADASVTLLGLARAYQQPAYQWSALRTGVKTIKHLYELDLDLKAVAPPAGQPASRYFPGVAVMVWRGGFGPRDSYIGVKGGDIPHFNHHCQMDFGSFVIHAEGRELLAEVEKWDYPYEGRKDPKVKGAKPGYYDIANKRWMRWDFDYVAATGHNMVTLEGCFPKPFIGAKARILSVEHGARHEATVIDSTCVYRPLARRVRRYVVFLRPDVVLLVDEIRAVKPARARVQFQPGGEVKWESDAFTIKNGPAELQGVSLHPSKQDHLIIGLEDRKTTYQPPSGLTEKRLRYLYVENLCRKPRLVFVTALQFGKKGFGPAAYSLEGAPATDDVFTVSVKRGRKSAGVTFNLAKGSLVVKG